MDALWPPLLRAVVACLLAQTSPALPSAQDTPEGPLDEEGLAEFLAPILAETMAAEHVPGAAVVVVGDGTVLFASGYGVADVETKRPVDPGATLFRIGSISKAVTALGVMRLADQGKLALDQDVNRYLSKLCVDARFEAPVTLDHLLTHTGGFDQVGSNREFGVAAERPTLEAFLQRDLCRIRPPGQQSCYDTYGISLAGYVAGAVSGLGYERFMRQEVFEPLGMARTYVEAPADLLEHLARGYSFADGRYVPQAYEYYASTPASSIDSTALDMAQLMIAVLGDGSNEHGRLYGAKTAEAVHCPQFRYRPELPGFTHGLWEGFRSGQRLLHHGGTMRGYSAEMALLPEYGLGIFVCLNRDNETGPPTQLTMNVVSRLVSAWFPRSPAREASSPPKPLTFDTARFAGIYAENLFCHLCDEGAGWWPDFLQVLESPGPGRLRNGALELAAVEPLVFASADGRQKLIFQEDSKGRLVSFVSSEQAPGSTFERIDERLLEELFGPKWREEPRGLTAAWLRWSERWEEAAKAYEYIAERRPEGSIPRLIARLRAGFSWVRAGDGARAAEQLVPALEELAKFLQSGDPRAPYLEDELLRAELNLLGALALAERVDEAFEWLERMLERGAFADPEALQMLREEEVFEILRLDPRFAELAARASARR